MDRHERRAAKAGRGARLLGRSVRESLDAQNRALQDQGRFLKKLFVLALVVAIAAILTGIGSMTLALQARSTAEHQTQATLVPLEFELAATVALAPKAQRSALERLILQVLPQLDLGLAAFQLEVDSLEHASADALQLVSLALQGVQVLEQLAALLKHVPPPVVNVSVPPPSVTVQPPSVNVKLVAPSTNIVVRKVCIQGSSCTTTIVVPKGVQPSTSDDDDP